MTTPPPDPNERPDEPPKGEQPPQYPPQYPPPYPQYPEYPQGSAEPPPYPGQYGGQPGYGQPPPPPGYDPYGSPYGGYYQRPSYASWWTRVGASLLDTLVAMPLVIVGYVALFAAGGLDPGEDPSPVAVMVFFVCLIGGLVLYGWNRWYRAGRTGQSLGKQWTNTYLVAEATGQPIGPGKAFLRDLAHYLDGICYIGYIMAAFDDKTQTFADKILKTIVVTG